MHNLLSDHGIPIKSLWLVTLFFMLYAGKVHRIASFGENTRHQYHEIRQNRASVSRDILIAESLVDPTYLEESHVVMPFDGRLLPSYPYLSTGSVIASRRCLARREVRIVGEGVNSVRSIVIQLVTADGLKIRMYFEVSTTQHHMVLRCVNYGSLRFHALP